MPRLIDADFVCERIEKEIKDIVIPKCPYAKRKDSEYDTGYNNALTMAKAIAEKAPTIEAELVRHGEWKEWWPGSCALIFTGEEMLWQCSECDAKYADIEGMHYCPNCGAKM